MPGESETRSFNQTLEEHYKYKCKVEQDRAMLLSELDEERIFYDTVGIPTMNALFQAEVQKFVVALEDKIDRWNEFVLIRSWIRMTQLSNLDEAISFAKTFNLLHGELHARIRTLPAQIEEDKMLMAKIKAKDLIPQKSVARIDNSSPVLETKDAKQHSKPTPSKPLPVKVTASDSLQVALLLAQQSQARHDIAMCETLLVAKPAQPKFPALFELAESLIQTHKKLLLDTDKQISQLRASAPDAKKADTKKTTFAKSIEKLSDIFQLKPNESQDIQSMTTLQLETAVNHHRERITAIAGVEGLESEVTHATLRLEALEEELALRSFLDETAGMVYE